MSDVSSMVFARRPVGMTNLITFPGFSIMTCCVAVSIVTWFDSSSNSGSKTRFPSCAGTHAGGGVHRHDVSFAWAAEINQFQDLRMESRMPRLAMLVL